MAGPSYLKEMLKTIH